MAKTITKLEILYVPDDKRVEVYRQCQLGMPEGYLPPEQLQVQDKPGLDHQRWPANHPRNLERIYEKYQVVDGTHDERCTQLRIRGMSVGDAILIDGRPYYVAPEPRTFVTVVDGEIIPVVETATL